MARGVFWLVVLGCLPASAYVIEVEEGTDIPMRWKQREVEVYMQDTWPPGLDPVAARAAIVAAFQTWSALTCDGQAVPFAFRFHDGAVPAGEIPAGANVVRFILSAPDWRWGHYSTSDVEVKVAPASGAANWFQLELNAGDHTWSTSGAAGAYDLQNVVTHEVGHVLGLDHSPVTSATLNEAIPPEETSKRELDPDDIAGYCALYGPSAVPWPGEAVPGSDAGPGADDDASAATPAPAASTGGCQAGGRHPQGAGMAMLALLALLGWRRASRARRAVAAVCAALAVLGCGGTSDPPTQQPLAPAVAPGTVVGRVVAADGSPQPGVTITLEPPVGYSVLTAADGSYALGPLPAGSYRVIPRLQNGTGEFEPREQTVTLATDGVAVPDFRTVSLSLRPSFTLSGTVEYAGPRTGRIFLGVMVADVRGWDAAALDYGGLLLEPGPFQLHGVPPGRYTIRAFRDHIGATSYNFNSPIGWSSAVTVTDGDVSGIQIVMEAPALEPLAPPEHLEVIPVDGGASVQFFAREREEPAESYNLYWSTDPAVSPTHTVGGGITRGIRPLPGGQPAVFVQYGLTNDTVLYFTLTEQRGAEEGPPAAPFGPITVGEVTTAHTFSGTVTFGPGYTPTGPLVISVENPRFFDPFTQYWTSVESPKNPQPFDVSGIPAGTYMLIVRIDSDHDGLFWDFDPSEEFFDGIDEPFVDLTGDVHKDVVFAPPKTRNLVAVTHRHTAEGSRYELLVEVRQIMNLAVEVRLEEGPALNGPMDLQARRFAARDGLMMRHTFDLGATRPSADPYAIFIRYYDGTTETVRQAPAMLDTFPTPLSPVGAAAGTTRPTFRWAPAADAPAETQYFVVVVDGDEVLWSSPAMGPETTEVEYDFNGSAEGPLEPGRTYRWRIAARIPTGARAETEAELRL